MLVVCECVRVPVCVCPKGVEKHLLDAKKIVYVFCMFVRVVLSMVCTVRQLADPAVDLFVAAAANKGVVGVNHGPSGPGFRIVGVYPYEYHMLTSFFLAY